jgi:hypothetical protein
VFTLESITSFDAKNVIIGYEEVRLLDGLIMFSLIGPKRIGGKFS